MPSWCHAIHPDRPFTPTLSQDAYKAGTPAVRAAGWPVLGVDRHDRPRGWRVNVRIFRILEQYSSFFNPKQVGMTKSFAIAICTINIDWDCRSHINTSVYILTYRSRHSGCPILDPAHAGRIFERAPRIDRIRRRIQQRHRNRAIQRR